MRRVLVIGIGSLVMQDDAIGPRVVKAIESSLQEHHIASFVGETDSQCCFEEIMPDDFVVIVDAMAGGQAPGSMEVIPLNVVLQKRWKHGALHELGLLDLIGLYAPGTPGCLIGIEAARIGFGFDLSEPLKARFDEICGSVLGAVLRMKEEQHA